MGFKSDREFLRNVSIGAIGTRKVAAILRKGRFQIIELERYSGSNKIWATKIKRLRVPDLLCLRTGRRIESRAKSTLKITMSHAVNNPNRAWDKGLRDDDIVAFISCSSIDDTWQASERVALFRVGDMRATANLAGLSRMKAASEGSEIQLTWPATIPSRPGQVTRVTDEAIETELDTGRRQVYRLLRKGQDKQQFRLTPYVKAGDTFGAGDTIVASVLPVMVAPSCPDIPQYDFLADLAVPERETVYAAVKALGYLPQFSDESRTPLLEIMENHDDVLLRLEAAGALARLGVDEGWNGIATYVRSSDYPLDVRMESALVLAELPCPESAALLKELVQRKTNESELRAAGAWGLSLVTSAPTDSGLLELANDEDELTAVHAIAGASRLIRDDNVESLLAELGEDDRRSAGIIRSILASSSNPVSAAVRHIQHAAGKQRLWLLYLLACIGRHRCEEYLAQHAPAILHELGFFWSHHVENWTNRLDVADQIDFLLGQILD